MSKVLNSLRELIQDERPLLSLQIVESLVKCPTGYRPVSKTYDEDSDAGLLRQNGLFGKKSSHYICLSKSEGLPGYVMDGVLVVGEREAAPAGFCVAGRAGKRRLCTRVSRRATVAGSYNNAQPPVTDVIVCSKLRQAPPGFMLAGEINGKMVCYKLGGGSGETSPTSPTHSHLDYENVNANTPDGNRLRPVPDRPPKLSPVISDLNNLNLKTSAYPVIEEFTTGHDYEALSPSYNIQSKPARPAPRPPSTHSPGLVSPTPRVRKNPPPVPRENYQTLAGYNGMDGVPFVLNPKLRGLPSDNLSQLPVVKKRNRFDLDRDYNYSFTVEKQT